MGVQDDGPRRLDRVDRKGLSGVLGSERCRYALSCLWDHGTSLALADVAEEVAIRERGTRLADIPAQEVKEVYMSLYHDHLPELVDRNLIEYDQEQDLVRPAIEGARALRRQRILGALPSVRRGGSPG